MKVLFLIEFLKNFVEKLVKEMPSIYLGIFSLDEK